MNDYSKPYLITYLNTASFAIYLLPYFRLSKVPPSDASPSNQLTQRQTAVLAAQFCCLWFLSNLFNNASYFYTSVSSSTILSSTTSFFTLILGYLIGLESITLKKVLALVVSFAGVVLVSKSDSTSLELSNPDLPLMEVLEIQADIARRGMWSVKGDILALVSAFLYGVYTSLLKKKVHDESRIDTKVFFGYVGVFNLIALWPFLVLLHYTGIETFSLPPSSQDYFKIILNATASLVGDYCWVLAMLMTTPLVVTMGLSATIPLSMIGDMIIYRQVPSILYFVGAAMVLYSFLVINTEENLTDQILSPTLRPVSSRDLED